MFCVQKIIESIGIKFEHNFCKPICKLNNFKPHTIKISDFRFFILHSCFYVKKTSKGYHSNFTTIISTVNFKNIKHPFHRLFVQFHWAWTLFYIRVIRKIVISPSLLCSARQTGNLLHEQIFHFC